MRATMTTKLMGLCGMVTPLIAWLSMCETQPIPLYWLGYPMRESLRKICPIISLIASEKPVCLDLSMRPDQEVTD